MKVLTVSTTMVFLMLAWSINSHAANQLVLHLSFDEGAGSIAKDSSKLKNDCTLKGNPKWIDGKFGKALELDGATWGEVADSDSLDLTGAMTIEAWVKMYGGGEGTQSAVEKGSAWIDGEYNLAALYSNGTILQMKDLPEECNDDNVGSSIQDNNWHFLVGMWDGGTIKLYIDGKLDKEMACAGTLLINNEPLFIGARGGTQRFLIGALDEIKIYNYALSEAEIAMDMQFPVAAVEPNGKLATTWSMIKAQK
jgi:hypothetical protein